MLGLGKAGAFGERARHTDPSAALVSDRFHRRARRPLSVPSC